MGFLIVIAKNLLRPWVVVVLMLVLGATLGYQVNINWKWLAQREAYAAQVPVSGPAPGATGTPALGTGSPRTPSGDSGESQPAGAVARSPSATLPGPTENEMDAAGKIMPVPKAAMPRGPRKLPPVRLVIPSIGVDTKIIELGTRYNDKGELIWETAPFAVGHHAGTANPGEQGNVVLSGHISSTREGAIFKRLPEIGPGDGVVVITGDRDYLYRVVEKKVVEPTQVDVMSSTAEEVLTLMTCVPDGVYTQRLVVIAKRV